MPVDLAIDNNGDLVFSASRDLLTVDGAEIVDQRIRMRLLLPLGTFVSDEDEILGSDIYTALRFTQTDERSLDDLAMRVQETLAPMEDIILTNVSTTVVGRALEIIVSYQMAADVDEEGEPIGDPGEVGTATVEIPLQEDVE